MQEYEKNLFYNIYYCHRNLTLYSCFIMNAIYITLLALFISIFSIIRFYSSFIGLFFIGFLLASKILNVISIWHAMYNSFFGNCDYRMFLVI